MFATSRTIFTGFSPNLTSEAVREACAWLLFPWKWKGWRKGDAVHKVEHWFQNYFNVPYALTFDSGRSALYFALKALGAGEGDEVALQAYTCVVVPNAIIWTGARPLYIDIGDDLTMDPENLARKITPRTKALIIQHTFGQPAKLDELLRIAKERNLTVIEDCAHSLGASYQGQLTGTFGDIGMFSFGADKVVSSVRGGALIAKNEQLYNKIKQYHDRLPEFNLMKLFQHLLHYPIFFIGKRWYHLGVGKWLLYLAKAFHLTNLIIEPSEKHGRQVSWYPTKYANALASLLLPQLPLVDSFNRRRQLVASLYKKKLNKNSNQLPANTADCIFLRFTLFLNNPQFYHQLFKKDGFLLGNWYDTPIAPRDIDLEAVDYKKGLCPHAEALAAKSINLPTDFNLTEKEINKLLILF